MDTREKIIPLPQAGELLETGDWSVIVGFFDPLTTVQARRIENGKYGRLLMVVLESENTLLSAHARCSLLAALRAVDFVTSVVAGHNWRSILPTHNTCIRVVEDMPTEKRLSEEFTRRIRARQGEVSL